MAKITIKGDTSGEVDIVAPAVAGSTTYNLSTAGGDILATGDIGTTVQGYDADTAKYDDVTANFTGTLQVSGTAVVKAGDNISTLTNDAGYVTGNQTITLSGDATGSGTTAINVTVADDSHNHIISNVDGLQTALDSKLSANQTITLSGDVSGSGTTSINVTVADDSHNHVISNVDGLQTALNAKAPIASPTFTGTATTPNLQITNGALVRDVTGQYGSIEVDGGATNTWEGFSIGGEDVFMSNGSVHGLYDDVNNKWSLRHDKNGQTQIYHNGSSKLQTTSGGINVSGGVSATSFSGDGSALTNLPASGKVLQVVQKTFTGTQSVSTPSHGYFTNITNLSQAITPSSTSSKILIMLNVSVMHPNDRIIHVKMSGGNSASFIGNSASNRARSASWVSAQVYSSQMMSLMYLDSPNTTSSVTYTPQMGANYTGTTWTINYNVINDSDLAYITRGASSMILMEIAG